MAATVGELNVKLNLELQRLDAQISQANAKIARMSKSWGSEVGKAAKRMNDDMAKVGMKLGIGFLGAENALSLVNREIRHVIENINEIPGISPETVSSISEAKELFAESRKSVDGWIAVGIEKFSELGQGLGYFASAMVNGWDATEKAVYDAKIEALEAADAAKLAAEKQKELEAAARAAAEAAERAGKAYSEMIEAYSVDVNIGEGLGQKIDRLKSEAAKLQTDSVAAGREDPSKAFAMEAEATRKLNEAKRAEIQLNEKAAELGERQAQAALDALQPAERLHELSRQYAEASAEIAATSSKSAAGVERLVALEGKRLDLAKEIGELKSDVMDRELESFFGDIDKKSAENIERVAEKSREAEEAARSLGLTFSSAFEDAIVEGKKFSDVLKGIAQDITRLLIRKAITEPAANFIAKGFSSAFSGFGFAGGGDPPVGKASWVGEEGPELFVPKVAGTVVSNSDIQSAVQGGGGESLSVTVIQNFAAGVSQSQLFEAMRQTKEAAKSGVMDAIQRRKGGFGSVAA